MKILVTGSTGFLGGRLCHALLSQGHSVRALVRPTSDISGLPSPAGDEAFELAYGDVTDFQSLLDAFSGCHVIFHAAALVEPWLPDPSKFVSVNVGGLKNVLQAAKETKTIENIIYTSSFFALGPTDGYIADENQVHEGKCFCTEYERSKAAADKIALQAASEGVPIVPVYPGVIYGSGKLTTGNIVAQLMIERFNGRLPGYIGYGNDKFSFSHVDDVVDGHIAAMNKGRPGERYLLTGENASFKHVFDMAAIITETKKPRFSIPLWVIEAYGWVSVLISRITGKLPLISYPVKRRSTVQKQTVTLRRSSRVANKPAPVYNEVGRVRMEILKRIYKTRDLSNRVYASDEARADAIEKAEKLEKSLEPEFPTFIKTMLQSHVTGGFWLGLPAYFCRRNLPKRDEVITLIDEDGNEYQTIYLPRKTGLSGGWKGFAVSHGLVDGDALVFQLIRGTSFKVYIIKVNGSEQRKNLSSSES